MPQAWIAKELSSGSKRSAVANDQYDILTQNYLLNCTSLLDHYIQEVKADRANLHFVFGAGAAL
jgi:hypothetical protein